MMDNSKTNSSDTNAANIVWKPVIVPMNNTSNHVKYPNMKTVPIVIFSAACIVIGITSIGIQIAALVINATEINYYIYFEIADYVAAGIWGGTFYVIAGSLGIAAAQKRTKSLLVGTVVLSTFSIAASVVAATLAGIAAGEGLYYSCWSSSCDAWWGLEWALMGFSILEFLMVIPLLVLASVALCCSERTNITNTLTSAGYQQQVYGFPNGQPIYFQPQMMQQQPQNLVQLQPQSFQTGYLSQL